MQLLYMGFSQDANIRCYRFQGQTPRERLIKTAAKVDFTLKADVSLLAQYHIRLQDGPSLCLQILNEALQASMENTAQFEAYAVTHEDLSAFASARYALAEAKIARRKPRPQPKPSPASQLKWPQIK